MKTNLIAGFSLTAAAVLSIHSALAQTPPSPSPSTPIPMDQLGAVVGKQYQGDGLSVIATPDGARLHCSFQRLEGHATADGLWLSSTAETFSGERFRVRVVKVGRGLSQLPATNPFICPQPALPSAGSVTVVDQVARFNRDGVTEEYSVSVDGVRQDFIIGQRPAGKGELRVELDVTGAKVEPLSNGARLVLNGAGRQIAYHRLQVVDARGQELTARLEVVDAARLTVLLDDAAASYPIRIDPTFSDANWISMNPAAPGALYNSVSCVTVDGSGNVYVGGSFYFMGDVVATRIAKWNGTRWSALGLGLGLNDVGSPSPTVSALAVSGNDLYVVGEFRTAMNSNGSPIVVNRIAKWDGNNWSALGSGFNDSAYSVATSGREVYVGGYFTVATNSGGMAVPVSRVARWNGTSWSPLNGGLNGTVSALASVGPSLYAGGYFLVATNAGGATIPVNRIAKWDGTNWSALGVGLNNSVSALAVSGSNIFAGGRFTMATNSGGAAVTANRIAKWDGNSWSALGLGVNTTVLGLAAAGSNVYAGGLFITATNSGGGPVTVNYIAKWNGNSWSALSSGVEDVVQAVAISGGNLYAGGSFKMADGVAANGIAKWNESSWSSLGVGMNDTVKALAILGTNLYVGGNFTTVVIGGTVLPVNHIARWDGNNWSTLGSGMNDSVFALAVLGTNLYAAGYFTTAGGVLVNGIAKWNGSIWSPLGLGMNLGPTKLAVSGNDLYAAGGFLRATNTGGATVTVNRIAKWNGTNWSALGQGLDARADSLFVSGSNVYVGGVFRYAINSGGGYVATHVIAKWNGSSWSSLGLGVDAPVYAFAMSGTDLYVGGTFSTATNSGGGAVPAKNIAKWNGTNWFAVGLGFNSQVLDLQMHQGELYAGGWFTWATNSEGAPVAANHLAKWNGTNWSALGAGTSDQVSALLVSGNDLYVGGYIGTAGGKASPYIARANLGVLGGRFVDPNNSVAGFSSTFLDATVGEPYRVQTQNSLASGGWVDFTNFTYTSPIVITAPTSLGTNRFFRAVTP